MDEEEQKYSAYVEDHPELKSMISAFLTQVITKRPKNIHSFAAQHFSFLANEQKKLLKPDFTSPLVICGPSGAGKGTLLGRILKKFPDQFGLSVSHTTRNPRQGEVHGTHYYFTTKQDFETKIKDDNYFVEYAKVHDNYYGTSFNSLFAHKHKQVNHTDNQDKNQSQNETSAASSASQNGSSTVKICVLEIDVQGAQKVIDSAFEGKLERVPHVLYIAPPSLEVLEKRLRSRGSETEETLKVRLANASKEMEWLEKPGNVDAKVVNDDLDTAFKEIVNVLKEWYPQITDELVSNATEEEKKQ